jgi:hypothetical protein
MYNFDDLSVHIVWTTLLLFVVLCLSLEMCDDQFLVLHIAGVE